MKITLDQVVPAPLSGLLDGKSEIWDTTVSFEQGKRYQVYAPSGKGKSTFIHILYGIRHDYTGSVSIDGVPIPKIKAKEWAAMRQQEMSLVFQDLRLFMNLTGRENIQVKSVLYKEDATQEIERMAALLGVTHVLDKQAALLSYGERQRVAIIRALIQPFQFLLLDEPFSHLDEENIKKSCQLMDEKCSQNNASLVMTSLGYPYFLAFDEKRLL
ncbi:ATP-binding cassette domain-containing protein [Microscilla marina]|uniref:ABC transporter ATP-binding protein n=1 Tax=Microscilla marina ATCC 23134 TaxID=313606 RepID=A1ZPL0_MICM2|nr:ATP-binding cassette domain-containing protein [Microscilla marina]EAY27749.1 ABC transporter ATP-binding protein [Microscilla marina ATCC 23134]